MVTPRVPKPGEVKPLAGWVQYRLPESIALPADIERRPFLAWLEPHLEAYAEAMLAQRLTLEVQQQRKVGVQWLQRALRELRRGVLDSLRDEPWSPMPAGTAAACYMSARKAQQDWHAVVVSGDVAALQVHVAHAIQALEKEARSTSVLVDGVAVPKSRPRRGPKPKGPRDRLLAAVAGHLRKLPLPPGAQPRTVEWAAEAAEAILVACGVPAVSLEQNADSIRRAVRRGQLRFSGK
jgi:hypothetical protein